MAEFGSGDGEFRRARRAQMAVERAVGCMKVYHSVMELHPAVAPMRQAETVAYLMTETRHLYVSLLECQSRIGDGMFDDYCELIAAHKAIDGYADRTLPHAVFTPANVNHEMAPLPDAELTLLIQIVIVLIEELARIDSETER